MNIVLIDLPEYHRSVASLEDAQKISDCCAIWSESKISGRRLDEAEGITVTNDGLHYASRCIDERSFCACELGRQIWQATLQEIAAGKDLFLERFGESAACR